MLLDTLTEIEQLEIKQCLMDQYTVIMAAEVSNDDLDKVRIMV